jgi:hypothetical protein
LSSISFIFANKSFRSSSSSSNILFKPGIPSIPSIFSASSTFFLASLLFSTLSVALLIYFSYNLGLSLSSNSLSNLSFLFFHSSLALALSSLILTFYSSFNVFYFA